MYRSLSIEKREYSEATAFCFVLLYVLFVFSLRGMAVSAAATRRSREKMALLFVTAS